MVIPVGLHNKTPVYDSLPVDAIGNVFNHYLIGREGIQPDGQVKQVAVRYRIGCQLSETQFIPVLPRTFFRFMMLMPATPLSAARRV
ncbi:hypothetical protein [Spirosoma spitsbergense]|uniref:hypothetical protein n=1 Tax=Spirosoma spitsbergense TaxID=431554 RepID=UPI0003A509C3|nr:hypothetical protein [Spirosoma spitsbergense]